MASVSELKERYYNSIRNMSLEQIQKIESGARCDSNLERYAQSCYDCYKAAEYLENNPEENILGVQME